MRSMLSKSWHQKARHPVRWGRSRSDTTLNKYSVALSPLVVLSLSLCTRSMIRLQRATRLSSKGPICKNCIAKVPQHNIMKRTLILNSEQLVRLNCGYSARTSRAYLSYRGGGAASAASSQSAYSSRSRCGAGPAGVAGGEGELDSERPPLDASWSVRRASTYEIRSCCTQHEKSSFKMFQFPINLTGTSSLLTCSKAMPL